MISCFALVRQAATAVHIFKQKALPHRHPLRPQDFFLSVGIPLSSPRARRVPIREFSASELLRLQGLRPEPAQFSTQTAPMVDYAALIRACPFAQSEVRERLLRGVDASVKTRAVGNAVFF